jgi:hypothetical protein
MKNSLLLLVILFFSRALFSQQSFGNESIIGVKDTCFVTAGSGQFDPGAIDTREAVVLFCGGLHRLKQNYWRRQRKYRKYKIRIREQQTIEK